MASLSEQTSSYQRGHHPKPLVVVLIAFYWRQILRYVLVTLIYLKKCMISMTLFKELSIKICSKFDEFIAIRICIKCFLFIFTMNYFLILFLVDSYNVKSTCTCADPESFVRGDQTLTSFYFFFFDDVGGERVSKTTISAPSSAPSMPHQLWPNIEFWLGSLVIFQRIWTSFANKPILL